MFSDVALSTLWNSGKYLINIVYRHEYVAVTFLSEGSSDEVELSAYKFQPTFVRGTRHKSWIRLPNSL